MPINNAPKEMPTGGCNPTVGAINGFNFLTIQRPGKAREMLWALFVLRVNTLHDSALFPESIGGRV